MSEQDDKKCRACDSLHNCAGHYGMREVVYENGHMRATDGHIASAGKGFDLGKHKREHEGTRYR
jgi:hypothetical protein